jgi:ribosomal subunit interface protein
MGASHPEHHGPAGIFQPVDRYQPILPVMEERMKLKSVDRDISVQSSNVDLGDALPAHARQAILRVAGKYFGRLHSAAVHFAREGQTYCCTVNMQMGALRMRSAEAESPDIYAAFDAALEKVATQLRRTKRAVRDHKGARTDKDIALHEGMRQTRADERGTEES